MKPKDAAVHTQAELVPEELKTMQDLPRLLSQAEIRAIAGGPETDATTGIG